MVVEWIRLQINRRDLERAPRYAVYAVVAWFRTAERRAAQNGKMSMQTQTADGATNKVESESC